MLNDRVKEIEQKTIERINLEHDFVEGNSAYLSSGFFCRQFR